MISTLADDWQTLLHAEFTKPYFLELEKALKHAYKTRGIYPAQTDIYKAFELCPLERVSVVILGQDPYHGPDQAHGLAFSVANDIPLPPSLKNIYQELVTDIGGDIPQSGNLSTWAAQGVLLLNSTLTVEAGEAGSHAGWGWEIFTNRVIELIAAEKTGVIFLLWGKHAQQKKSLIDGKRHHILESAHPSPLSAYRGFFGCRHFSQTNAILVSQGKSPISWL